MLHIEVRPKFSFSENIRYAYLNVYESSIWVPNICLVKQEIRWGGGIYPMVKKNPTLKIVTKSSPRKCEI